MLIARIVVSNDIIFEENPFINSLSPLFANNHKDIYKMKTSSK